MKEKSSVREAALSIFNRRVSLREVLVSAENIKRGIRIEEANLIHFLKENGEDKTAIELDTPEGKRIATVQFGNRITFIRPFKLDGREELPTPQRSILEEGADPSPLLDDDADDDDITEAAHLETPKIQEPKKYPHLTLQREPDTQEEAEEEKEKKVTVNAAVDVRFAHKLSRFCSAPDEKNSTFMQAVDQLDEAPNKNFDPGRGKTPISFYVPESYRGKLDKMARHSKEELSRSDVVRRIASKMIDYNPAS